MNTRYVLPAMLILLAVNGAWIWGFVRTGRANTRRLNESHDWLVQANREAYLMKRGWEYSIRTNGKSLPRHLKAKEKPGREFDLQEMTAQEQRLVVVLSERHCSSCIDQVLFLVKNEIPENERDHVMVLYSGSDQLTEHWLQRKKILTEVDFLEIPDQSLLLPMDSLEIPYLFMTGPSNEAGQAYAPFPALEIQTRQYLQTMRKRFFQ